MHMILHHLKVALRNLTKYKLQDLHLGTEHHGAGAYRLLGPAPAAALTLFKTNLILTQ